MENLDKLVLELCKLPQETGWVEFKHNNCDPKMVGEDISALANSAVIADRSYAYMIWGIDDNTHEIIGTKVSLKKEKKGNQELENWLRYLLSKNADFEMHSVDIDGKHIEILIISKAVGVPVTFEKEDAEFIYVFDKNLTPTSLSVDVKYSFATTMKNAALNTVMGLGTVFVILIMLIFLISLFQFIPGSGAQEAKAKKKAAEEAAAAPTPATVAADPVQEADNSELIAVIAAAIAASEGTSTDGFVVRSIRKINRKKR